jgi:gamma-D-glutamyl-L-lysine dipeptidyl-peptidase
VPAFKYLKEIFDLRLKTKIDIRTVACQVEAVSEKGGTKVTGFSLYKQTDAFIRHTAAEVFGGAKLDFDLKVLSRRYPLKFQEVAIAAAPFYKQPEVVEKDLLTEALYGCVVRTYFSQDGFTFAQHPDGYVGYVPANALHRTTPEHYLRWKNGPCAIARVPFEANGIVVPSTAKLVYERGKVLAPNGNSYAVPESKVKLVNPSASSFVKSVVQHAEVFKNTPYLWGGKTERGIDCSGFVQSVTFQEGIKLPRDASMQAGVGEIVGYLPKYADLLPGDILFFMNDKAFVFHVGIYLGDSTYIHSSGKKNVVRSSLLPRGANYLSRYGQTFAFARRVHT